MNIAKKESKIKIVLGLMIIIAIISVLTFRATKAKYQNIVNIPLAKGTINYSLADFEIQKLYVNNIEVEELSQNATYTLDENKSYCTLYGETQDVTISYDSSTMAISVNPLENRGLKCNLYFNN